MLEEQVGQMGLNKQVGCYWIDRQIDNLFKLGHMVVVFEFLLFQMGFWKEMGQHSILPYFGFVSFFLCKFGGFDITEFVWKIW